MKRTTGLISALVAVCAGLVSCEERHLEIIDSFMTASVNTICDAEYGGTAKVRIEVNRDEYRLDSIRCAYAFRNEEGVVKDGFVVSGKGGIIELETEVISSEDDAVVPYSFQISDEDGNKASISGSFIAAGFMSTVPKSISLTDSEVLLHRAGDHEIGSAKSLTSSVKVSVIYPDGQTSTGKGFIVTGKTPGWDRIVTVSIVTDDYFIVSAPKNSLGGKAVLVVTSKHDPTVSAELTVYVKRDLALIVDAATWGPAMIIPSVNIPQMSYGFAYMRHYLAQVDGVFSADMISGKSIACESLSINQVTQPINVFNYVFRPVLHVAKGTQSDKEYGSTGRLGAQSDMVSLKEALNAMNNLHTAGDDCRQDSGHGAYTSVEVRSHLDGCLQYTSDYYRITHVIDLYKTQYEGTNWTYYGSYGFGKGGFDTIKDYFDMLATIPQARYWYVQADNDVWIHQIEK